MGSTTFGWCVCAKFGGHPTALDFIAYQQATKAKKVAIEKNKKIRVQRRAAAAAEKESEDRANVGTKDEPGPLYLKGKAARWENLVPGGSNFNLFSKPELVALAVVDGNFVKKDINKLKKGELLTKMTPYFLLKQAELPRHGRSNAGIPYTH